MGVCPFFICEFMPKLSPSLQDVIVPIVEALGYEFWGGQFAGQGSTLLRIYIDKKNGVTIEDCKRVSQQLSVALDVEGILSYRYVLEVSSPGLERPLFTLAQFEQFIGQKVRLKLYAPINGQSRFAGKIVRIIGETVVLDIDNHEFEVPFSQIEKANLTFKN